MTEQNNEHAVEETLGRLLQIGVLLAATVVGSAGIWYLIAHGSADPAYSHFRSSDPQSLTFPGILAGIAQGQSDDLMRLGLILLIATPVARVFFSLLFFLHKRDFIYSGVTLLVLGILAAGIAGL